MTSHCFLEEALAVLRQTVASFPDDLLARNSLAETLRQLGQSSEALALLQDTILRFPDDIVARNLVASLLSELGRPHEALDFQRDTILRFPNNALARNVLATILRELGSQSEGTKPMTEDRAITVRRELLKTIYDKYMESPTAQIGWNRDETDPDSAIRIREAKWLHNQGIIAATFGAAGDFMAKLTVKGRDYVVTGEVDRSSNPTKSSPRSTEIPSMKKPRIFIGSSVEGHTVAEYVQLGLDHEAECTIWSQGAFGLSEGPLDSLFRVVKNFEFAVLVLTPDDLVHKRGSTRNSPRDNVLFELGLFMGALGRERTYIVHCRDEELELPTDLAGVTAATYAKRSDGNLRAAIGPVCTQIKSAIKHREETKANP